MQGQGLRDSAQSFADADAVILGASFDTPAENLAFAEAQQFPYALLSDVDRAVGALYDAVRGPGEQYGDFPRRISYLIDPAGVIRRAYDVTDVAGHASAVLGDLHALQADPSA